MIEVDHIRIASRDAHESALTLAEILGTAEPSIAGANGEMSRVDLEQRPSLLFDTSETVGLEHIAFRVDNIRFAEVVTRLRERGLPFGNHPEDPRNGKTDDFLGGTGRIFFLNSDGHLFEVFC